MSTFNPTVELRLERAEEIFQLLVESVSDYAIFVLDATGRVVSWNSGAERITGYTASEIVGRHFSTFYPKDQVDCGHPEYELKIAREKGVYKEDGPRIRKDGSTYISSVTITAIKDIQGVIRGFAKVTQDVTERKEQERRLRESEERNRLLVEAVKDYAIFVIDPEGYIVSWNTGAQRIKQYRDDEIIGKHFSIFYPEELQKIKHPQRELEIAKQFGRYEEEGARIRKDGTHFQANVVITPLYDASLQLRGFAKVTRDITERKIAEEKLRRAYEDLEKRVAKRTQELQQAKEAAESANRAKTAFLANMSHEIRTPLGAVMGFSEMLSEVEQTAAEKQECRDAISRNGKLLVNIIDDILDLSKIESGQFKIEKTDVMLTDLISQVSSVANLQAQEKGLEFTVESEGKIPVSIHTDPVRIKQILMNLIGNAVKFTSSGSVRIVLKEMVEVDRTTLNFIVQDTGPGIDAEGAQKLFQPFSQVDSSLTRKFGGTGLGLALSKRLAVALGGDVDLTSSKVGFGSTFTFRVETESRRSVLFSNKPNVLEGPQHKLLLRDINLAGVRILLVEDMMDNRTLIKRYLQNAGAIVECAENGLEGLEKSRGGNFDVVLMDLSMPVMNGYEATLELRKAGFTRPIIALTAHAMIEERQRTASSGFDDHLTKPIDGKHLVNSVLRLIKNG